MEEEITTEKEEISAGTTIQTTGTLPEVATRVTPLRETHKMIDSKTEVAQLDLEATKTEVARTKIGPAEESTPWECKGSTTRATRVIQINKQEYHRKSIQKTGTLLHLVRATWV